MKNIEYNYWLCNIEGIGIKKRQKLLKVFTSPKEIFQASSGVIKNKSNLSDKDIYKIIMSRNKKTIRGNYENLADKGIKFISLDDSRYPRRLKEIYDPPFALYLKGELPDENKKSLAIIGARECTLYGKELAKYLSSALAQAGLPIISGLARGIDSYAHEGALSVGSETYGVLGCGIDVFYPRENINLYREMEKNGGIISEYGPGVAPLPGHFPMRNRIISGLSDGILVVEARVKSGSLITVDMGLDQGKDIYAIPGRIGDSLSEGCNKLIQMGAKLVNRPEDILEEILVNYDPKGFLSKKNTNSLERKEKVVYACLGFTPKHIEEISQETGLDLQDLGEVLLRLELENLVKQTIKNFYISNK